MCSQIWDPPALCHHSALGFSSEVVEAGECLIRNQNLHWVFFQGWTCPHPLCCAGPVNLRQQVRWTLAANDRGRVTFKVMLHDWNQAGSERAASQQLWDSSTSWFLLTWFIHLPPPFTENQTVLKPKNYCVSHYGNQRKIIHGRDSSYFIFTPNIYPTIPHIREADNSLILEAGCHYVFSYQKLLESLEFYFLKLCPHRLCGLRAHPCVVYGSCSGPRRTYSCVVCGSLTGLRTHPRGSGKNLPKSIRWKEAVKERAPYMASLPSSSGIQFQL